MRGEARYELKQNDEALTDLSLSIALDGTQAQAFLKRGNARFRLKEYEQAIADYDRAEELGIAGDPILFNNRGKARQMLGLLPEALSDYDRALALKPDYGRALDNRGACRFQAGDYPGAIGRPASARRSRCGESGQPAAAGPRGTPLGQLPAGGDLS
jgi:tetratricopeptide (TPR) repeat protein